MDHNWGNKVANYKKLLKKYMNHVAGQQGDYMSDFDSLYLNKKERADLKQLYEEDHPPPPVEEIKEIDLVEIPDGNNPISLNDLKEMIPILQEKYGQKAVLRFDAGYNNVSAYITPEIK